MMVLAAFQVFCARVANTLLTSWSPLTYERGDALMAFEEENEVHEPAGNGARVTRTWIPKESLNFSPDGSIGCFYTRIENGGGSGSCGHIDSEAVVPTAASATPAPVDGIPPASPGAGPQLPMFEFSDLQAIVSDYLVNHFPWPDGDGKFGCTCGTQGFTIAAWSEHVSELQVSETVYYLTGLLYDQQEQR